MPPKPHKPPRRTLELPAKLRTELQNLGHLPAPGKGKLGRKDRRKQARQSSKDNRAAHFAGKRKAAEEEAQAESAPAAGPSSSKAGKAEPVAKRRRVEAVSEGEEDEPVAAPAAKKKMTALERMLAKQEGGGVDPGRKKSKAESYEDDEIAWLEAKLGVRPGGPATKAEKGKWKDEFLDDGLDDLFEGIDDLEGAAFGGDDKDYSKLLQAGTDDDMTDASDDDHLHGSDDEDEDDDETEGTAEYGLSDDELMNPSDDDDHREMGEIGSDEESEGDEGAIDLSELEGGSDDEDEESDDELDSDEADNHDADEEEDVERSAAKRAKPSSSGEKAELDAQDAATATAPVASTSTPTDAAAPVKGRYVPPHLRAAAAAAEAAAAAAPATPAPSKDAPPPIDPRLRRQIMGHLNKLSALNMAAILSALEGVYAAHPRAVVTATLTTLLLEIIATRDNLGEQLIINYACLVAALSRTVGIELPAGVVAKSVEMWEQARDKASRPVEGEEEEGFEGRPGSKEAENLVAFLAEMYNFQVVGCVLVYDIIRNLIESGLNELEVELLVKLVKRAGQQLRTDDPSALKEIITLVKQKMQGVDPKTMNSRTRFMIDALTNLKNNKIKPDANGAVDHYSPLKKFLSSLARGRSVPEPLRLTLADLRSSEAKGKWWLVGAAWSGDPLAEGDSKLEFAKKEQTGDKQMARLAKAQGMNTDIRKGVFTVLMTSEDYVDACERLLQLGLSDVQQREIARVLLQCAGNEKAYNPYYTLVAHRMAGRSHSFAITLQYCLWDFLREMGESKVGGEEMVRNMQDEGRSGSGKGKVSERRAGNIAKLYAWCVAKDVLSLAILKPVPFARLQPQTATFFRTFFAALFLSSQTASPALVLISSTTTKRDQAAVEKVFVKALPFAGLVRGLSKFVEEDLEGVEKGWGEKEAKLVRFGRKVAGATLGVGGMELGERF